MRKKWKWTLHISFNKGSLYKYLVGLPRIDGTIRNGSTGNDYQTVQGHLLEGPRLTPVLFPMGIRV